MFFTLFLVSARNWGVMCVSLRRNIWCRSARNIEKLVLADVANLSTYDILRADQLVIDRASLKHINEFYGEKQSATSAA